MTRAERRARTEAKVRRKLYEWRVVAQRQVPENWVPGTLRKGHHWFACGKTRCFLCHHEKLSGIPRRRDVRQLQSALSEE